MRASFLDKSTVDRGDLSFQPLEAELEECHYFDLTAPTEVVERIRNVEVVVSNKVVLAESELRQATNLKLICLAATGTNNVDLDAAKSLNIAVTNVTRYAAPAVAQHVFALILALSTRLLDYQKAVLEGAWQRHPFFCLLDFPITELAGKTIGIVGYGDLGQAVAKIARAFDMKVLIAQRVGSAQPQPDRIPLQQLLTEVDVLSLHCPLVAETRHLIGAEQLALMKPNALLINTARGAIVDEYALAHALRNHQIAGAGIDVLAEEPPVAGSPLIDGSLQNLIVTPHIAWATQEARQRLIDEIALNVRSFKLGEQRNIV